jgi:hypothetical protein
MEGFMSANFNAEALASILIEVSLARQKATTLFYERRGTARSMRDGLRISPKELSLINSEVTRIFSACAVGEHPPAAQRTLAAAAGRPR